MVAILTTTIKVMNQQPNGHMAKSTVQEPLRQYKLECICFTFLIATAWACFRESCDNNVSACRIQKFVFCYSFFIFPSKAVSAAASALRPVHPYAETNHNTNCTTLVASQACSTFFYEYPTYTLIIPFGASCIALIVSPIFYSNFIFWSYIWCRDDRSRNGNVYQTAGWNKI